MSLLTTSHAGLFTTHGLAATSRIGKRHGDDDDLEFLRHNLDERLRRFEADVMVATDRTRSDPARSVGELGRGLRADLDAVRDARRTTRSRRLDLLVPTLTIGATLFILAMFELVGR